METDKPSEKRKNENKFPSKNHYTNNVTVRIQRNQAEKQRRDRLNDQIAQLATLVPPAVNASKPLDKVSILRLSASWMRLNYSCLNAKRFKSAVVNYLDMHHSLVSNLDVLEKSINGFIIATTFSGVVLMCSRYSEEYIGYQNIDLLGHHISNFVLPKEKDLLSKKMRNLISKFNNGSSNPRNIVRVRMQQRPLPRSSEMRYRKMSFSLSVHSGDEIPQTTAAHKKSLKIGRHKDFGESAVILIFAEPVQLEPDIDVQYLEQKDCYFTIHGTQGEIIFADHRISIMTGYMPRDVLGNSAYQYIHSSDVPIALFAQQAMFASSDGTGIITYRLRIRDSSFIYLQTKGQIRYKDSTKEVRQFICCNILLSDEDGSRELKKFQDRYAPQLNASKLKLKDTKIPTKSPPASNVHSYVARVNNSISFEHENLKQKSCLSETNGLIADAPMDIEEPNKADNSKNCRLRLDLSKINYKEGCNRRNSLSSNSDISPRSSFNNSPKSSLSDGFSTASPAIQIMNCNTAVSVRGLSCNVQCNNKFSSFDPISPIQSMSSSNDTSVSFAESVIPENNCLSATNSTFLTSDLLLIPDDFTPYDLAGTKSFFTSHGLTSSQDNCMQNNIHDNIGNFNISENTNMATDNFFIPQDAFQNHATIRSEPLNIPHKATLTFENGHESVNNVFPVCHPKSTYVSDNHSALNAKVVGAATKSIPDNSSRENLDLSFLDNSVENMALLSDLSDFYENSILKEDHNNQYQMETAISNSSVTDTNCLQDSSVLNNGANSYETDVLGLFTQLSSESHINNNAHSPQQSNDYLPDSYFVSDSDNSVGTNAMQMRTFNADYLQTPVPEREWQMDKVKIHCNSSKQKINDHIYSQFQTNAVISNGIREVHKGPRNGMNHLYDSMNSQSAFLNRAQNEYVVIDDLVNQSSTSPFPSLDGSKFKTLK